MSTSEYWKDFEIRMELATARVDAASARLRLARLDGTSEEQLGDIETEHVEALITIGALFRERDDQLEIERCTQVAEKEMEADRAVAAARGEELLRVAEITEFNELWDADTRHYEVAVDGCESDDVWLVEIDAGFSYVVFRDWLYIARDAWQQTDKEIVGRAIIAYKAAQRGVS